MSTGLNRKNIVEDVITYINKSLNSLEKSKQERSKELLKIDPKIAKYTIEIESSLLYKNFVTNFHQNFGFHISKFKNYSKDYKVILENSQKYQEHAPFIKEAEAQVIKKDISLKNRNAKLAQNYESPPEIEYSENTETESIASDEEVFYSLEDEIDKTSSKALTQEDSTKIEEEIDLAFKDVFKDQKSESGSDSDKEPEEKLVGSRTPSPSPSETEMTETSTQIQQSDSKTTSL